MTHLKKTIEVINNRMKEHHSLYIRNEIALRGQIIEPILRGLGWDTENPEEVQLNVSVEEGVPDYSLLKDDKKVLFIEAKNLSLDIERKDIILQVAKYCYGEGMKYGVLTNGAIWILVRASQEGTSMRARIVWKTDIENDEKTAIFRRLNTISKGAIEDIEKLGKKLQVLDEIWQSLLDNPNDLIRVFIPVLHSLIREGYSGYKFDEIEIEDFIKERVNELIPSSKKIAIEAIPINKYKKGQQRKIKVTTDNHVK